MIIMIKVQSQGIVHYTRTDCLFILDGSISIEMHPTSATWYGMTYKEDKDKVVDALEGLVKKGEYPSNLWASLKTKD